MKADMDDHKARFVVMTQVLTVIGRRLDGHDQKLATVDANDSDVKNRLASMEHQIVTNDAELKQKLCTLETQHTSVAQAVETMSTQGQQGHQGVPAGHLANLEARVDTSLKGLESAIHQVRADFATQDEAVYNRLQVHISEIMATLNDMKGNGPAPAPGAFPRTVPPQAAPAWSQSSQPQPDPWAASRPAGSQGPQSAPEPQAPGAQNSNFPQFNTAQHGSATYHHVGGDRKIPFEDKVAISSVGQYREEHKLEWVECTRNYLISKAFEMDAFLRWAESAESSEITHTHISWLANSGFCSDNEPHRLSHDLWGYLNLSLSGNQKIVFNNVPKGNGFEAWRRIIVSIAPRSEARLHDMHGDVHRPPSSKRLADVMYDIDKWETLLREYYRCGGSPLTDKTKVVVAMKMLPPSTPASVKMALNSIASFEAFKAELGQNITNSRRLQRAQRNPSSPGQYGIRVRTHAGVRIAA